MKHKMKIGVLIDCLKLGVYEGIKKASELGVQGVQFHAVSGKMLPDNLSKRKRKELLDRVKSYGLEISAVCGDLGGYGFTLNHDNNYKIELLKKIMELAKDLESDIVTTHIGVVPETLNEKYEILYNACYRLGTFAKEMNSVFAIETGPENVKTLKRFLDDINSKGIGVNYDPANLVMVTGDDPIQGVYELKEYIVHTHAKDGIMVKGGNPEVIYNTIAESGINGINLDEYFKETPLGEGSMNFVHYIKTLDYIGYEGFLTIERETGNNPTDDIKKAVKFLNEIL